MKRKALFLAFFLGILLVSSTLLISNTGDSNKDNVSGKWLINNINIEMQRDDPDPLTIETSLFGDLYLNKTTLVINKDGSTSFPHNGTTVTARFAPEGEGKLMRIYFTSGTQKKNGVEVEKTDSYSDYLYTLNNKGMTLQRQDALVKETYTFVRK